MQKVYRGIIVLFITTFLWGNIWIETSQFDFRDGVYEKNIFASNRHNGSVEFLPRFDLDNNGYVDLFVAARLDNCHYIYWGASNGYSAYNRTIYPSGGTGGNCDAADVNFDGYPDFLVIPLQNSSLFIYWGTNNGPNPSNPQQLSIPSVWNESGMFADLNKDGYIDIVTGNRFNNQASIFWGSASGYSNSNTTELPTQSGQHNVEVADFNKDNWLDILFINDNAPSNYLYWGSPSGYSPNNYQTLNNVGIGHGSSVADLNGDGFLDLIFTTRTTNSACIYYGSSSGYSNYVVLNPGQGNGSGYGGSSVADFNQDGFLDIIFFTVGYPMIYWGSVNGYSDANRLMIPFQVWTASGFVCNLNGDGFLDVLLGNWGWDGVTRIVWGPNYTSSQALGSDYDHHGMFREVGNVYNRKYYEDYISSVFDAGEEVNWGTVNWDDSLPPGTSIAFFVRSGNTPNPNVSWSNWDSLGKGDEIPDSLNSRYLQYRARLKYTSPAYLPYLYEVRIDYGPLIKLILEPNQADSTLPAVPVDYNIRVINIGIGLDTIDLVYQHNTNWQVELFDSTGTNPLIDNNNNSMPDVVININDTVPIVLTITPPNNAQGGEIDSLRLIGKSNINPRFVDTAYIVTKIRRVVAILIGPDQIDSTIAGVPIGYDLWVHNQGTNRDTIDLYYTHQKPWGISLLDSTGAFPLTDHNNNGLVDVWVNNRDSVRFRLVIYSPDTALIGETDSLTLNARSSLNPNVIDRATIITVIKGVGSIIVFPDQHSSGFPGNWVNFVLTCCNNQHFTDTVDITVAEQLGWQYVLLDSLGNPLRDHNNNGLVDLPNIQGFGAKAHFQFRLLIPSGTPSGVVDSIIIFGYSGSNPSIKDSALLTLTVSKYARVLIAPDCADSGYYGDTIDYRLYVQNLGNFADVIDLQIFGALFDYSLRDIAGNLLRDHNNNGLVDVGVVIPSGIESLLVRVFITSYQIGLVDTVVIRARSGYNPGIYDDVQVQTRVMGGLFDLDLAPDWEERINPNGVRDLPIYALLQGSVSDIVDLKIGLTPSGWSIGLIDTTGQPLIDNDLDGAIDLGPIVPQTQRRFFVRVSAPQRFDLIGDVDSLSVCEFYLCGWSSMREELRDSVRIKVLLVPPFDVHNYKNPFRSQTRFIFSLPKDGRVRLEIYNRAGELVRRLINNRFYNFGIHHYPWDGKNDAGERLAPGAYIYILEFKASDGESLVAKKKAVIIR